MTFESTGKAFNHMTIRRDGSGQVVGWLGERAFALCLMENNIPFYWVAPTKAEFDFIVKHEGKVITVDVKSKERNVSNAGYLDAHVTVEQKEYDCKIYVFANVIKDTKEVQLCGWLSKAEFWRKARIVEKGDSDGNLVEHKHAGKVKHKDLRDMESLIIPLRMA